MPGKKRSTTTAAAAAAKRRCPENQGIASDISILSECALRNDSIYDSPFFQAGKTNDDATLDKIAKPAEPLRLTRVMKRLYSMPKVWCELFDYVHNKNTEISWKEWTFLSLQHMENRCDNYKQKHWIDVAMRYFGMGWVVVLCWDKIVKKWFIIRTGGSNYYDDKDNTMYFIDNADTPDGFNSKTCTKLYNFHFIRELVNKDIKEEINSDVLRASIGVPNFPREKDDEPPPLIDDEPNFPREKDDEPPPLIDDEPNFPREKDDEPPPLIY